MRLPTKQGQIRFPSGNNRIVSAQRHMPVLGVTVLEALYFNRETVMQEG